MKVNDLETKICFYGVSVHSAPFGHITVDEVLSPQSADEVLTWLESTDNWKLQDAVNHKSHGFYISDTILPDSLKNIFTGENLANFLCKFEKIFNTKFEDKLTVGAVKHQQGHGTVIHSDYNDKEPIDFTHRFILYLNRGWQETDGGILGLFKEKDISEIVCMIPPVHNSGVGLVISPKSYHAVSLVKNSERYSLVFSLLSKEGKYERGI